MNTDHVVIDTEDHVFHCEHCGVSEDPPGSAMIEQWVRAMQKFVSKHENCDSKCDVRTLVISGHGDTLVRIVGDVRGAHEFLCHRGYEYVVGKWNIGRQMRLYAINDGCWSFSVCQISKDKPLPNWPVRVIGSVDHSAIMEIDVPAGVIIEKA